MVRTAREGAVSILRAMVYCGKPSKGCGNCRFRRLKCDQNRPGCSQCRNACIACLGYRDPESVTFRDESARITLKVQRAEARKAGLIQTNAKDGKSLPSQREPKPARPAFPGQLQIVQSMGESIQDVAIGFLLGDYIRGSHFDYLPSLYESDEKRKILSPIVQAVGLASLSLQTSRPELQDQAQKLYVDAISKTNRALQCTNTARNDEVLASILLLSLYETLSSRSSVSIEAWTTHMQGALTLVALRGPKKLETKIGMDLFKQIASSIRMFCVQHGVRVPQQLRDLNQKAKQCSYPNDIAFEYPVVVEAFTDLRADIVEGLLSKPEDIVTRADSILAVMEDIQAKLSPSLLYDCVIVRKPCPEIYGHYYHRFSDHHMARIWNTTWMATLNLSTMIYEQVIRLSDMALTARECNINLVTRKDECQRGILEAVGNICASVPQFFPPEEPHMSSRIARKAATGYFLIWPLFTAGSNPIISPSTRDYIIDRLKHIGNDLKLPPALKAAQMLERGDSTESWMHIYHVF